MLLTRTAWLRDGTTLKARSQELLVLLVFFRYHYLCVDKECWLRFPPFELIDCAAATGSLAAGSEAKLKLPVFLPLLLRRETCSASTSGRLSKLAHLNSCLPFGDSSVSLQFSICSRSLFDSEPETTTTSSLLLLFLSLFGELIFF